MTERYLRQTYKNLLNANPLSGRDENLITKDKNILIGKVGNVVTQSNPSSQQHVDLILAASSATMASSTSELIQPLPDFRNALGDIGNKLTAAINMNMQNLKKQLTQEGEQAKKPIMPPAVVKFAQASEIMVEPPMVNSNNSCSMIEVESSEDEEEEQDDDDDDDEEEQEEEEEEEEEEESLDEDTEDKDVSDELILLDDEDEDEIIRSVVEFPKDVIDIDEEDRDNTQLLADYVKDIYHYIRHIEKKFRVDPEFLSNKTVSAKMRSILVDWLTQVHLKFHLLNETLFLTIQIIDAYLEKNQVSKMQLQLVGVSAMFVACKYEEMYVPAIDDFVYMTDNTYTKSEIRQMEISILKSMGFMLNKPLPLHFLRRFSKAGRADPKQHTLAKFFMELSLHDAEFSSFDPSYLAASSLCLSFKLLNGSDWSRQLEFYSTYKKSALLKGMSKLAKLVLKSQEPEYKYKAVGNKFSASKFMRISLLPELTSQVMRTLADNEK